MALLEQEVAISQKYTKKIKRAHLDHPMAYDNEDHLAFFCLDLGRGRRINFRACARPDRDIDSLDYIDLETPSMKYHLSLTTPETSPLMEALLARAKVLWAAWQKGAEI